MIFIKKKKKKTIDLNFVERHKKKNNKGQLSMTRRMSLGRKYDCLSK